MNKTFSRLLFGVIFVLGLGSCAPQGETIWIISTNDMHGAIDKFPELATLVGDYRNQDTASVFLFDAGDRSTGNPFVDMADEPGQPIIDLMNALQYDVATLGNHEFDQGQAILAARIADSEFATVVANMEVHNSPLSQPAPYTVLHSKGGKSIGVLGLITNFANGHPDGKDEVFDGLWFSSPFVAAEAYEWLRSEVDILVALTHIGDDADMVLACEVPIFDLIVGGHTHVAIEEPLVVCDTRITQGRNKLRYASVTKITTRGKKIAAIENQLISLDTITPDSTFTTLVEGYYNNEELNRPIGILSQTADINGVVNLVTDVARQQTKADFALYHIGGIRIPSLAAGGVSKADMFTIDPFASQMVVVEMTLPQIREMIIDKYNDMKNAKESHRADIFPSGMSYTIITNESDEAIDVTFSHKLPYASGTKYKVAMADYMYKMYDFDKPEVISTSLLVTDMLIQHFEKSASVRTDNTARVTIRQR